MLSQLISYIQGYLCIRINGNSTERFLNACRHREIRLWGLRAVHGAYEMNISIRDFKKLKPVIRKTGTKVVMVKKFGLPFCLYRRRKRKMFFVGAVLCVFLIFWMSRYIWNIDIEGNISRTDETLIEFLKTRSIQSGMEKSKVDCARIVKDIRKEYDDIIWVSAYIKGTRLMIHIKENEDSPLLIEKKIEENEEQQPEEIVPEDIIAVRDCTIDTVIIRNGILMVKPGSKVKKGDVLVSGLVPVINDAGETVSYQYHIADADIIGKTSLEYEDTYSNQYIEKEKIDIYKEEYFLKIGDIRFALGGIKNDYEHFSMGGVQYQLKIFSNLTFPIFWGIRRVVPYEIKEMTYSQKELQKILTERFLRTSSDLGKKGVEIIENNVKIYTGSKETMAKGNLEVRMPVGEKRPSQIIDIPENSENEQTGDITDGNDGSNN
ncbi:MAG: sporulation protein YqfD [Lachnospiraceae bacterium]